MDAVSLTCGASMWIGERKSTSSVSAPVFQMCCAEGEALLAPPRTLLPIIVDLLTRNGAIAKEFKQNIRSYNSALRFTSMNADLDRRYAKEEHGAYAFRIHGSVHHRISPELIFNPNNAIQQLRFAQIYIFDSTNELQNRLNVARNVGVLPQTMQSLQNMMHDVNPFVDLFKTMEELIFEQPNGIEDIRMIFYAESDTDIRHYNAPTVGEIGVLIVGGEDESSIAPCNRDIALRLRGNAEGDGLQCINMLHQDYDPLHYVLMFPTGESGWDINIESYNLERMEVDEPVEGQANRSRAKVSIMHYHNSQLMIRADLNSTAERRMHSFGKLFHQYIVDQYAKMKQQRLNFIIFNQQTLHAELYNELTDMLPLDDTDVSAIGQKVILPSTFVGGPRFMAHLLRLKTCKCMPN